VEERRALQNEVATLRRELAMGGGAAAPADRRPDLVVNGVPVEIKVFKGVSGKELPAMLDELKARNGSGAYIVLGGEGDKTSVAIGVTPEHVAAFSAKDAISVVLAALGGKGGGGRPDLAQGGAPLALSEVTGEQIAARIAAAFGVEV